MINLLRSSTKQYFMYGLLDWNGDVAVGFGQQAIDNNKPTGKANIRETQLVNENINKGKNDDNQPKTNPEENIFKGRVAEFDFC